MSAVSYIVSILLNLDLRTVIRIRINRGARAAVRPDWFATNCAMHRSVCMALLSLAVVDLPVHSHAGSRVVVASRAAFGAGLSETVLPLANELPVKSDDVLTTERRDSDSSVSSIGNASVGSSPVHDTVVSVCKVELLWQRITSGGRNGCNGVVPCAAGVASTRASMARAAALGFTVLRFGASGFWPPDQMLFVDRSTRPHFLAALDSVFDDAKALGIRLIPSLQWNHWAFADVCNETLGADMMRRATSCSQRGSKEFVSTIVERYSTPSYNDVIYAWELGTPAAAIAVLAPTAIATQSTRDKSASQRAQRA